MIDGNHRYNWMKNGRSLFVNWDPTTHLALKHNQLTSKRGILSLKSADRSERRNQQPQKEKEQRDHRGPTLCDSFSRSNGQGFQHTQEMSYVFDLAIYTAPPRRSRAIDRYARSAQLPPGSDEALMLEAMRAARFAILILGRRHDAAGVIATDLFRRTDVWLVDIGLEASLEEGAMMATRLYTPEQFSMTAGVNVPFDLALIEDLYDALPRRLGETRLPDLIDDRRFAETIYRVALADGIMDRVTYQDPPEDAS